MNDRQAVFTYLMNCRSQMKVSTFLVMQSGVVNHNYVVVHDAPPAVVQEIVGNFKMVGLKEGKGLLIPLTPEQ
jgi:hypothetical protein